MAILKNGLRLGVGGYRPAGLTSGPCKVLKSITREHACLRPKQHLELSTAQHGFVKHRSCLENLFCFLGDVTRRPGEDWPVEKCLRAFGIDARSLKGAGHSSSGRTFDARIGETRSGTGSIDSSDKHQKSPRL